VFSNSKTIFRFTVIASINAAMNPSNANAKAKNLVISSSGSLSIIEWERWRQNGLR
jgi:hypothetical protein